jgi:Flp pilus assembly pilin Flp
MTIDRTKKVVSEAGQTMAEYAVVLTMIVLVTLVAFAALGDGVANALQTVRSALP